MAKILVAWELGGGTGHCVNLLPIVKGLVANGHQVYAAVRDLHTARNVFGDLTIEFLQAPQLRKAPTNFIRSTNTFAQILHNVGFSCESDLIPLAKAWQNIIELIHPAIVICENSPIALLACRKYDFPRVLLGSSFFSTPDIRPLPPLLPINCDLSQCERDEAQILTTANEALKRQGVPQLERISQLFADVDEDYLLTFEELDHYPDRVNGHYRGMWSPPDGVEPNWPSAAGPRVFAYVQPPAPGWNPLVASHALRELGYPSLIYAPAVNREIIQKMAAPNIKIEANRLNMATLGPQCDLLLTHGNNGTATQLLLAGVPQLHVPLYIEQAAFSQRVASLGAAIVAKSYHPVPLAGQLSALAASNSHLNAAQSFARKYERYDPDASIAEIAERVNSLCR